MSQRIAICIGVNKHRNVSSINLRFARGDAESIASILANKDQGQFDKVLTIFDEQATKANVLGMLKDALLDPTLTKDDLVLVFFSGHGALDNGENLFLVPHDIGFLGDNSIDFTTCIHIKDLEILLDNTRAGSVLIIMDACHSGASGKLLGRIKYSDSSNIVLIGAARYSEPAWETSELAHGRFTQSLLNCINERPSYGDWITLQQALSFVQIDMGRNGALQTAEVSSHLVNQNVILFKNPMYTLTSSELVEKAKSLCELSNCVIVTTQPNQTFPNTFILREPRSFGRCDYTMVMCLDNSVVDVNIAHINQLNVLFRNLHITNQVATGLLITRNELPGLLKDALDREISSQTVEELRRNLMNFERYLRRLVDDFIKQDPDRPGEPALHDYYVELSGREQQPLDMLVVNIEKLSNLTVKSSSIKVAVDPADELPERSRSFDLLEEAVKEIAGSWEELRALLLEDAAYMADVGDKFQVNLSDFQFLGPEKELITDSITQWLGQENTQMVIVLGGYGTGKTTFARKLACDLSNNYLSESGKSNHRIPILIPLRKFPKFAAVDIEAAIVSHLKQECKVANPDFAAFREMNDAGLYVLIFDGFDEMAVQATEEIIKRNFLEIMQLASSPNAKVLITSRPEAFLSGREEAETLLQQHDFLPERRPSLRRIELCSLSSKQIELFLQRRVPLIEAVVKSNKDWTYYRDQINSIMGLKELAQRPVLLEMTIKTLPKLIQEGGIVTRPRLYETYLTGEIIRQQRLKKRDFLIADMERRIDLIQIIAKYLYVEKQTEMTVEQLQKVLQAEFSPEQRLNSESYARDLIACSFLAREGDHYRFSHLSFMEYLVAKCLRKEIESDSPDILRRLKLTSAVRGFLLELRPSPDDRWRRTLWDWIHHTAGRAEQENMFLGGNAVSLLHFMNESLQGADFSGAVLCGADLTRANLNGAQFTNANLEGVMLIDASLLNADFRRANLDKAVLVGTIHSDEETVNDNLATYIAKSPRFDGASLINTQFNSKWRLLTKRLREINEKERKLDQSDKDKVITSDVSADVVF